MAGAMQFLVVSRIMDKGSLKGFTLVSSYGQARFVDLAAIQRAVLQGKTCFTNASFDWQYKTLVGTCNSLTSYPEISLQYKIIRNGIVVQYTILNKDTKEPVGVVCYNALGVRYNFSYKRLKEFSQTNAAVNFKFVKHKKYGLYVVDTNGNEFPTVLISERSKTMVYDSSKGEAEPEKVKLQDDKKKEAKDLKVPGERVTDVNSAADTDAEDEEAKKKAENALPMPVVFSVDEISASEFNKDAQEKLMLATYNMAKLSPYYHCGLASIKKRPVLDGQIHTMAVTEDTLYYNMHFVSQSTTARLTFVLIHEICHIAMQHSIRKKDRIHELWNIACDLYINAVICRDFHCGFGKGEVNYGTAQKPVSLEAPLEGMYMERINETLDFARDTPESLYTKLVMGAVEEMKQQGSDDSDTDDDKDGSSGKSKDGNGKKGKDKKSSSSAEKRKKGKGSRDQDSDQPDDAEVEQPDETGLESDLTSGLDEQDSNDSGKDKKSEGLDSDQGGSGSDFDDDVSDMDGSDSQAGDGQGSSDGDGGQGSGSQGDSGSGSETTGLETDMFPDGNDGDGNGSGSGSSAGMGGSSGGGSGQGDGNDNPKGKKSKKKKKPGNDDGSDPQDTPKSMKPREITVKYNGKNLTGVFTPDLMTNDNTQSADATKKNMDVSKDALQRIKMKKQMWEEKNGQELLKNAGAGAALVQRHIEYGLSADIRWEVLLKNIAKVGHKRIFTLANPNQDYMNLGMTIADRRRVGKPDKVAGVVIAIDVSGSVSTDELEKYLSEVNNIFTKQKVEGELIYWSTMVGDAGAFSTKKDLLKVDPTSTGGTDVRCVFDYLSGKTKVNGKYEPLRGKDIAGVFILTDGCFNHNYADYAPMFGNKTVWIIDGNAVLFDPPFGRVVEYDRHDKAR